MSVSKRFTLLNLIENIKGNSSQKILDSDGVATFPGVKIHKNDAIGELELPDDFHCRCSKFYKPIIDELIKKFMSKNESICESASEGEFKDKATLQWNIINDIQVMEFHMKIATHLCKALGLPLDTDDTTSLDTDNTTP
jgi:hypothetical protein